MWTFKKMAQKVDSILRNFVNYTKSPEKVRTLIFIDINVNI